MKEYLTLIIVVTYGMILLYLRVSIYIYIFNMNKT